MRWLEGVGEVAGGCGSGVRCTICGCVRGRVKSARVL